MGRHDDRGGRTPEERRAPFVDATETVALVAIPAVGLAVLSAVGGAEPLIGLVFGAILGSFLGMIRRSMNAVRTQEGIVRRPRQFDQDGDSSFLVRLADAEYDPRYELVVAVVGGLVGVGALAAIVLLVDGPFVARWLVAVALFGLVGALGALGSYTLR